MHHTGHLTAVTEPAQVHGRFSHTTHKQSIVNVNLAATAHTSSYMLAACTHDEETVEHVAVVVRWG